MAATVAITHRRGGVGGHRVSNRITITMDSSYATGGEAITANACGLGRIDAVDFHGANGGYIPEWDQTNLKVKVNAAGLASVSKTVAVASMTDNTDTTGFIDFATSALPIGAIPISATFDCTGAFAGDTTAVWKLGIAGDLDRYSAVTSNSCFTAIKTSTQVKNATAVQGTNAARTPRLTITGSADFTSIVSNATGAGVATLYFLPATGTGTVAEVDNAIDLSTIVFTADVYGTP